MRMLLLALLLAACGDDDDGGDDDDDMRDAASDAMREDARGDATFPDSSSCVMAIVPPTGMACRTMADCISFAACVDPASPDCGGAEPPPPERACEDDSGCAMGQKCVETRLPCASGPSSACVAACTATSCPAGERCADGLCEAIPCDAGFSCPANQQCDLSAALADPHGCVRKTCMSDEACDCGYCVMGRCHETLFECRQPAA